MQQQHSQSTPLYKSIKTLSQPFKEFTKRLLDFNNHWQRGQNIFKHSSGGWHCVRFFLYKPQINSQAEQKRKSFVLSLLEWSCVQVSQWYKKTFKGLVSRKQTPNSAILAKTK